MAYFPNSTSGEVLDAQCMNCPLGAGWHDPDQGQLFDDEQPLRPCPVWLVQLTYNYDQLRSDDFRAAMNLLINEHGICQVREQLKQIRKANNEQTTV